MAKKGIPAWDEAEVAPDHEPEVLFEVSVVSTVGTVYRDPDGEQSAIAAAFGIISDHVEDSGKQQHAEYRFPDVGSDKGEFLTVTVTRDIPHS